MPTTKNNKELSLADLHRLISRKRSKLVGLQKKKHRLERDLQKVEWQIGSLAGDARVLSTARIAGEARIVRRRRVRNGRRGQKEELTESL